MEKPQNKNRTEQGGTSIIRSKLQWNYFWHFTSLGYQPLIVLWSINTLSPLMDARQNVLAGSVWAEVPEILVERVILRSHFRGLYI